MQMKRVRKSIHSTVNPRSFALYTDEIAQSQTIHSVTSLYPLIHSGYLVCEDDLKPREGIH